MATTASTHHSVVDLSSEERSAPAGRATRSSTGQRLEASGVPEPSLERLERRELPQEAIDRALDAVAMRRAIGELTEGGRVADEVIDELLAGARTEEEIAGPGGLLAQLTKRLVERALEVELTEHLGYERHREPEGGAGNIRNGTTPKTLVTDHGRCWRSKFTSETDYPMSPSNCHCHHLE